MRVSFYQIFPSVSLSSNSTELDDGAYNPLWTTKGFTQTFHFWKENRRQQSTPLNAFLTYVTLPWWSIAKGKYFSRLRLYSTLSLSYWLSSYSSRSSGPPRATDSNVLMTPRHDVRDRPQHIHTTVFWRHERLRCVRRRNRTKEPVLEQC